MTQDLGLIDWILMAGAVLGVLYLAVLVTRRAVIRRSGGAVECSLRQAGDDRWRRGVAAYRTDQLYWFSSYGVGLRPDAAFERRALQPMSRESCDTGDRIAVRFETGANGDAVWLAMSNDALTGMLAWLEAGPQYWFN